MANIVKFVLGTTPAPPQSLSPLDSSMTRLLPELPDLAALGVTERSKMHIE